MIQVRIRAFHMDSLPRCEHRRVLCSACGIDPFDTPDRSNSNTHENISRGSADGDGARHIEGRDTP